MSSMYATVPRTPRTVPLVLKIRAATELRSEVLRIDNFRGHIEPLIAGRIFEGLIVLYQASTRTVGYAVAPQPAGREAGRHHRQISARLLHVYLALSQPAPAPRYGAALKAAGIIPVGLLPCRDRIALHRSWSVARAGLTRPESFVHVPVWAARVEMEQARLPAPVG